MPINNTNIQIGTEGPPGSQEGFGDVVHPSRQWLLAMSSESEISRSLGDLDLGPSSDYPIHSPFYSSSAALATTVTGKGQHPSSPTDLRNMTSTDHDSLWLMPISTAVTPELWNTNSHIKNGTNTIPNILMGDIEGTYNDSHANSSDTAAQLLNEQTYCPNIVSLHVL
jgi:hypothetical protein